MIEKYSLENAQNEAQKIKDLVGSRGEKDDYETAEKMVDEEREASEKETRELAQRMVYAVQIDLTSSLNEIKNFNILRSGINNALRTLSRLESYRLEFSEENSSTMEGYKKYSDICKDYLLKRLIELNIKSEEDLQKKLQDSTLTAESFEGDLEDIFPTEQVPNYLRARFFYSKAVDDYTKEHPRIRENLPNRGYSLEEQRIEEYGFQKPYVNVTHSSRLDLSNEPPFSNPDPIEKYNPDDPSFVLYPAYEYEVSRKVGSAYKSPYDSDQEREFGNDPSVDYTHIIRLHWYTSLAMAASKTQETIERIKLNLELGESSIERYKRFKNEQLKKEKVAEDAGAFKLYSFESFDRDTESKGVFMISAEGILISPTEEENISEGRYGKKDRSKGITRIEKTWKETPTGVSVVSYDVTRNKAKTRIIIKFKPEVSPPLGLSNLQKQSIEREIKKILNAEKKNMPKVNQFDVEIDEILQNAGIINEIK